MSSDELAAIVDRTSADEVIPALKSAGIYDRQRRIEPLDGDELAIPVTETKSLSMVDRFERGIATSHRRRTLADYLLDRGWTTEELDLAPSSYARVGDIIVVSDDLQHRPHDVGAALLELHGDTRTVVSIEEIEGEQRHPEIRHIAGENRTTTIHREHGLEYALDLQEVMFSIGNQHERIRMRSVVTTGERVLDLCAGIGYFTLPIADGGGQVIAIEHNPTAFRWLSKNMTLNGLDDRITPVMADCRTVTASADRAIIGHLPVHDCRDDPRDFGSGYLDTAVRSVSSGWLHVHGIAWSDHHDQARDALCDRLTSRGVELRECSVERVKGIAPKTDHIVIDARIRAT